jgi:short-subunit dehydrogenase
MIIVRGCDCMKALVTGASSGIGYDIAKYLNKLGYELILVAKDQKNLEKIKDEFYGDTRIINLDLSNEESCYELYKAVTDEKIDILVNNAGFGVYGEFTYTDINKELEMINVNIKAVHILTKLFLKDMKKRNKGYILNVASLAAFQAGPLMASYGATKSYVLKLTMAIYEELRQHNSKVGISILCPGPVDTNFNRIAGINKFSVKAMPSSYVAKYTVDQMLKKKLIIIPGLMMKASYYGSKILPMNLLLKINYSIQKGKAK